LLATNVLSTSNAFPPSQGITATDSGTLDIHGKLYTPTWTRLASTVPAGNSTVVLQDAVDWQPGQLIVVATSTFKDEINNQNEVATITEVSADGKTLSVNAPFKFQHYGGPEYQAEVALLSRNIIFQGGPETESTKVGPHIRMENTSRISGVMVSRDLEYRRRKQYRAVFLEF